LPDQIKILPQTLIKTEAELMAFETECIDLGFEGVILRKIDGHYKYGRSTANEGLLLKVKRFADAEATVTGFVEQMHNTNEKVTNELGRGKRSTHAAGLVGKNTLGALVLCDLLTGATFQCGTGMNDVQRQHIWNNQSEYLGLIWKYKHFPTGAVDLPRHPVSLGPRNIIDMG
jgi:DNA ligase-1